MTAGEDYILWVELGLQISAEMLFQCKCKSSVSAQNSVSQNAKQGQLQWQMSQTWLPT